MMKSPEITFAGIQQRLRLKKPWDSVLITALSILTAIPIFLIAHQNLIDPEWYFQFDRILIFIAILSLLYLIFYYLRALIVACIIFFLVMLLYGSTFGQYGFFQVFDDYRAMIYTMAEDPHPQDLILSKLLPFPNKSRILNAVEYDNPRVRNFTLMATTKHFRDVPNQGRYRQLIQCFAAFVEINGRWNYVNDPKGRDYIARASESLLYLSGDCDDHAILMAACVRAIGGTPRLIHTTGHIYPEILIGNKSDLEQVNYLIKKVLFAQEAKGKDIHYHIDERGQVWLNLDYTAKYPGGPFMREEILGALTLN